MVNKIKMKRILIILSTLISNSWTIGLQGLLIPQTGHILATSSTGIAGDIDPSLNPAMNISNHPFLQFSLNHWLGDIKGSQTQLRWGNEIPKQLHIQSWKAKDIELWGERPGDSPLGTFGVHYLSAGYSISHHLNTPFRFGLRIQTNYSHLFTEYLLGTTLDIGTLIPISSSIILGAVIRNVGYEYTNKLRSSLPIESGIGFALKIAPTKTSILTDLLYNAQHGQEIRIGLMTNWRWLNFSAGTSVSNNRNASALGFSFSYRRIKVNYGIYFHEKSSVLGTPQFLDIRRYL